MGSHLTSYTLSDFTLISAGKRQAAYGVPWVEHCSAARLKAFSFPCLVVVFVHFSAHSLSHQRSFTNMTLHVKLDIPISLYMSSQATASTMYSFCLVRRRSGGRQTSRAVGSKDGRPASRRIYKCNTDVV